MAPLLSAVGFCIAAADGPKPAPFVFPTVVGSQWIYVYGGKETNGDTVRVIPTRNSTETVIGVESRDGAAVVTFASEEDIQGQAPRMRTRDGLREVKKAELTREPSQSLAISGVGIAKVRVGRSKLDHPLVLLKFPVKPGESWDFGSKRVSGSGVAGTMTVHPEPVEVPAGKFTAVRVEAVAKDFEAVGKNNADDSRVTFWYVSGVGEVKMTGTRKRMENGVIRTAVTERVLKSFIPGKDRPASSAVK